MSRIVKHTLGQATIKLSRRVNFSETRADGISSTGYLREEAGTREGVIELEIDLSALLRMCGSRALSNSRRVSHLQGGAIKLRVVKGSETETTVPHVHNPRCFKDGIVACGVV